MALAALKLFKYYRPAQVHVFSSNEYAVNMGFRILAQSYGIDVTKQREFQKSVDEWDTSVKKVQTSKAMVSYLSRAKEQDEFMKEQEIAYQIGKRHLANMMGEDPNTFTQDDVDRSIEYLFPSAIFDKKAKPLMKPPHEVFPIRKAAEFDESGRPHDFLFYTGKPAYFKILFDIWTYMKDIEKYQDALIKKKVAIDQNEVLSNLGYTWLTQDEFQIYILETIREKEYENFILTIERLMAMPYSTKYADFVNRFRKRHIGQKTTSEIPQPLLDISGRAYVTTFECLRKSARGDVTIRSPGTGLIKINGKDITYFDDKQSREQVRVFYSLLLYQ